MKSIAFALLHIQAKTISVKTTGGSIISDGVLQGDLDLEVKQNGVVYLMLFNV